MKFVYFIIIFSIIVLPMFAQNSVKIYLDVSKSMQAYMSSEQNNSFQATLLQIKGLLTSSGYSGFELNTIGKNISKQNSFNNIERYSMIKNATKYYNASETNLVGVLSNIINEGNDINILITDGVLSKNKDSSDSSEKNTDIAGDCSTGYDIGCFMKRFADILDENYVVHVIGVTSHFIGNYYSEILKIKKGKGYTIIENKGINRPFYMFIFGRNLLKTEEFVKNYLEWFDTFYNPGERGLQIRSVRVSPIDIPKLSKTSSFPKYLYDSKINAVFALGKEKNKYRMIKKIKGKSINLTIPVKLSADYKGSLGIDLGKYIVIRDRNKLSPPADKSKFQLRKEIDKSGKQVNFKFYFSKNLIRSFKKQMELRYSIWADIDLAKLHVWKDWSTMDDGLKENLGKTLNISPLLTYIIKNSVMRLNIPEKCRIDNSIKFLK